MKLGIITRYTRNTINYGNVLQTYALNAYLRDHYPDILVETVVLNDDYNIGKVKTSYFIALVRKIFSFFRKNRNTHLKTPNAERIKAFQRFADNNIIMSKVIMSENELSKMVYDVLVVGSDVVWAQIHNNYNRVKFLCFKGSENAIKFSYAASFGRDYIPFENKKVIRNALLRFQGISVREKSSINLLDKIGIKGSVHVCDPTLLISLNSWLSFEENPVLEKEVDKCGYIFVMLLNIEDWQLKILKGIKENSRQQVFVVTNGYNEDYSNYSNIADEIFDSASPGEWIWLINHANFVITDSFHCMIFSSIFNRKFIVFERSYDTNINNRMIDYLDMIGCNDLFVKNNTEVNIGLLSWDYSYINSKIEEYVDYSKHYINMMIMKK